MATPSFSPLSLDPESTLVLAAYSAAQPVIAAEVADGEAVGWIPRLTTIQQVPAERLPPVHGRLIALGLLRFQLLDRTGGMMYRLSPEGRSALSAMLGRDVPPLPESMDASGEVDSQEEVQPASHVSAVEATAAFDN